MATATMTPRVRPATDQPGAAQALRATGGDPDAVTAAHLMTSPVVSLGSGENVLTASLLLSRHRVHHLVVVDPDGRCLGMVDDRMLSARWPTSPAEAVAATMVQYVHGPTACVLPGATAARVARTMCAADVDAVPVVDPGGHVVGVVTSRDLLRLVAGSDTGDQA